MATIMRVQIHWRPDKLVSREINRLRFRYLFLVVSKLRVNVGGIVNVSVVCVYERMCGNKKRVNRNFIELNGEEIDFITFSLKPSLHFHFSKRIIWRRHTHTTCAIFYMLKLNYFNEITLGFTYK